MANHTGQAGLVKLGTDVVGSVTGFSIDTTGDVIESSNLGSTARTYMAGRTSFTASVDANFDEGDSSGQLALTVGSTVALKLYPEGADSGDYYWSGSAIVTGESHSVTLDDLIKSSMTLQGSGVLTRTTV
jgi:hypothetical protein